MTLLEDAQAAIQSIEDSAQVQSDVISGDLNTVVPSPAGGIRTVANAINVMSQTNPTGDWITATAYNIKDLVVESGIIYIATIAHTSGVFATDFGNNNWVIHQGLGVGVTPWASYPIDATFNGAFPNATDVSFFFKRLDDELFIRGGVFTGTGNTGNSIHVDMPSGFTIDVTKLPADAFTTGAIANNHMGEWKGHDNASTIYAGGIMVNVETPETGFLILSDGDQILFGGDIAGTFFNSNSKILFDFRVPIL